MEKHLYPPWMVQLFNMKNMLNKMSDIGKQMLHNARFCKTNANNLYPQVSEEVRKASVQMQSWI